jgi:hypothetical protein
MEALINIQKDLKAPKNQTNAFGKYKYRSCEDILEALKPLLSANECTLIISDEMIAVGNRIYVKATATIKHKEIQETATAYAREPETQKGMSDPQLTGSASSYARKYALNGLFAIDDTKDHDTMDNSSSASNGLITDKQQQELRKLLQDKGLDYMTVCTNWNLKSLSELQANSIVSFKDWLGEQ